MSEKKKMNILLILTDQHRADHMGCSGHNEVKTPNLDNLAGEGLLFNNAFCANPMCMPNRSSIITGCYPSVHGCRSNGINLPNAVTTAVETLHKNKYHTINIGKMHFQYSFRPYKKKSKSMEDVMDWIDNKIRVEKIKEFKAEPYYGFEEVEVTIGHGDKVVGHYTDWLEEKGPSGLKVKEYIEKKLYDFFDDLIYDTEVPEDLYPTTYVEERTIAFLKRFTDGKCDKENFFLQCSFPDPHHPICPPGKYKDMYQPENIELPKTFKDLENLKKAKHPFLSRFLDKEMFSRALLRQNNEEETRRFLAGTFGAVSMVDNSIGNILTALDELGLAENTIVVYTSDHGDLAGDHGMCLKGPCPFSGILRVPMIWKVPGITPNGAVSDSLMSSIDISRTFLSLVDIKERRQPEHMQGLDFTPVLKDSKVKVRDHCYIEEDEERQSKMRVRHLITETHKLTVYEGIEDYGDIYDLKNDPDELHNLWFEDEKLRIKLMNKLFHVSLSAAPRLPKRQALT